MRIKQIELIGFKSFADKVTFRLHHGVTCIVGPNGCGKSNVVDSFRWVLGEQSAKSLRGEKMEEVIFQGSANVKPKGMAEVSLIITQGNAGTDENGNGHSPAPASPRDEVIVSRRLYRSGESEYLINKKQCRLKDIKDIFLDTGLDVKSYSIMDQGKVSEIINTKPQDRRYLIEEVAGVMKYKVRKAEALSKLESSKQNLQRINDIVHEVRRQINSLDRQVKKAERYKRLSEEMREIELRMGKRDYVRLSEVLEALQAEIERLGEIDSSKRGALSSLENQIETKRLEMVEKEKALTALENDLYAKEREIAEAEKLVAVLKTEMENKRNTISRLTLQQEGFDARREELLRRTGEIEDTVRTLSASMTELSEELRERKASLTEMELVIGDREGEIEEKRRELFRVSETLSHKKNELQKLLSSLETLTYRESSSLRDRESIQEGLAALEKTIGAGEEGVRAARGRRTELLAEQDALVEETERVTAEIEDRKALLSRERESLASNTSRLHSLKELTVDRSLMDLLAESRESLHFSGQVLSDIVSAGKEYEKAVEAALSEKINSLLLSEAEDIIAAVRLIKEKNLGKTALLYSGFDAGEGKRESTPLGHEAVIGKVSDFISFENSDFREAAGRILENTYIVRDLQSAIEIRKTHPLRNSILATLDGEVIDRDGVILAGQGKDILKRKREIRELQRTVEQQQALIATAENEVSTLTSLLAGRKELLRTVRNSVVEVEKEISLSEHSLQGQREESERKRRRLSFLDTETAALAEEKETLTGLIAAKEEEIGRVEKERESLNEGITTLQSSIASVKAEYEEARSSLTDIKLTLGSHKEKIEALQREGEHLRRTIQELERSKESAEREIRETETRLTDSAVELRNREEGIRALVGEADRMRQERAARKEVIETENRTLLEESNALRALRAEIDSVAQEMAAARSKEVEHRLRRENRESSLMQKYGIEIGQEEVVLEGFDAQEDSEKAAQLGEKIRDLGPVNLGTIEEYEELKTRYDFLTQQQQDLNMSIAELEEAISRINASTRRKLREAYDALRTKFAEVFTLLFGGGKADIVLTDEENILESGLDIVAQPPGKKLQNIHLMSGGEKALTSLTLLFAGFLIKPSPLCILDEVDAPLDESNTFRFSQMIRELSRDTQFIVITHNKTTMEAADYLYGITMEEPGVSKALSLQFAGTENVA
ncbi:MAG: chromosome segregation protein SMC [Alphaproteobacteria bacterium]|uniref:Chromosome partition protein Smc n=1 Tax=Candidatus Nitrobium versatile TaxID=2884831 RepID=A0A953J2P7_9BACT|nr:chromosome segregation protein SMC [Candidatus Nitrobium versatile]